MGQGLQRARAAAGETRTGNCPACWHLRSLHGPGGCTAKVYPAHSLTGEPCPCEQVPGESRDAGSRVIEQAGKRAAELFAMAEDENWLGI